MYHTTSNKINLYKHAYKFIEPMNPCQHDITHLSVLHKTWNLSLHAIGVNHPTCNCS